MLREETGVPVRWRSTETRSTYNIVVEVEGVIDFHYASLTSEVAILFLLLFRVSSLSLTIVSLGNKDNDNDDDDDDNNSLTWKSSIIQ